MPRKFGAIHAQRTQRTRTTRAPPDRRSHPRSDLLSHGRELDLAHIRMGDVQEDLAQSRRKIKLVINELAVHEQQRAEAEEGEDEQHRRRADRHGRLGDDGDDRANVVADGGDYGCDTVFQMTQLRPRTRMCH